MFDYCECNDLEKAVDYDTRYYRPEDDSYNGVKKPGWSVLSP